MTEEEKMIDTYVGSDFSIVCRPTGCLDWTGAAALRHAVHNVLCPEINLHIDLRHLNFVDAVGMSALVGSVRRVRAVGGKARIQNASPAVRRRLQIVGVYEFLTSSPANVGRYSQSDSGDAA
ncbi:MAG: STAS domain-containing protein [Acidimicrobiales bacterium]